MGLDLEKGLGGRQGEGIVRSERMDYVGEQEEGVVVNETFDDEKVDYLIVVEVVERKEAV